MRKDIKKLGKDQRLRFKAKIDRFGTKNGYRGGTIDTVLLVDIEHDGKIVTDHLWFNKTKFWQDVKVGDIVEFDARPKTYTKGYLGNNWYKQIDNPPQEDWKISFPTKLAILNL